MVGVKFIVSCQGVVQLGGLVQGPTDFTVKMKCAVNLPTLILLSSV